MRLVLGVLGAIGAQRHWPDFSVLRVFSQHFTRTNGKSPVGSGSWVPVGSEIRGLRVQSVQSKAAALRSLLLWLQWGGRGWGGKKVLGHAGHSPTLWHLPLISSPLFWPSSSHPSLLVTLFETERSVMWPRKLLLAPRVAAVLLHNRAPFSVEEPSVLTTPTHLLSTPCSHIMPPMCSFRLSCLPCLS